MSRNGKPTLAVVGATGAVGAVMLDLLTLRADIWGDIRLVASAKSAGRTMRLRGEQVPVAPLTPEAFDGADVVLFDVPEDVAAEWAPVAVQHGAVAVDTSDVFRMDADVPLVVPEVNPQAVHERPRGIVAGPNAAVLSMIVAIDVLHRHWHLNALVVATFEAASGVGYAGIDTLHTEMGKVAGDRSLGHFPGDIRRAIGTEPSPFPAPLAFNVVPWVGEEGEKGFTTAELKMRAESRKILDLPRLRVSTTCVRVPVLTGHSLAIHAVFEEETDAALAQKWLRDAPSITLYDDPATFGFPTPVDVVGTDPTWVGRVRKSLDNPRALDLFVVADNLRKGAALNAVQVAELVAHDL